MTTAESTIIALLTSWRDQGFSVATINALIKVWADRQGMTL